MSVSTHSSPPVCAREFHVKTERQSRARQLKLQTLSLCASECALYIEHLGKKSHWYERYPLSAITRVENYGVPILHHKHKPKSKRTSWRHKPQAPHLGLHFETRDASHGIRRYVFENKKQADDFANNVRRLIEFGPLAQLLATLLDTLQQQIIDIQLLHLLESLMQVEDGKRWTEKPIREEKGTKSPPSHSIDEFVDWFTRWAVQHRGLPILQTLSQDFAATVERLENQDGNTQILPSLSLSITSILVPDGELSPAAALKVDSDTQAQKNENFELNDTDPQSTTSKSIASEIDSRSEFSFSDTQIWSKGRPRVSGVSIGGVEARVTNRRTSLLRATAAGNAYRKHSSSNAVTRSHVRNTMGDVGRAALVPSTTSLMLPGEQLRCHEQRVGLVCTQEVATTVRREEEGGGGGGAKVNDVKLTMIVKGELYVTSYCITFQPYANGRTLVGPDFFINSSIVIPLSSISKVRVSSRHARLVIKTKHYRVIKLTFDRPRAWLVGLAQQLSTWSFPDEVTSIFAFAHCQAVKSSIASRASAASAVAACTAETAGTTTQTATNTTAAIAVANVPTTEARTTTTTTPTTTAAATTTPTPTTTTATSPTDTDADTLTDTDIDTESDTDTDTITNRAVASISTTNAVAETLLAVATATITEPATRSPATLSQPSPQPPTITTTPASPPPPTTTTQKPARGSAPVAKTSAGTVTAETHSKMDKHLSVRSDWHAYDARTEFYRQTSGTHEGVLRQRLSIADNSAFDICQSYMSELIVPSMLTKTDLQTVAKYRSRGRLPAVTWIHAGNGAVLTRSSQPMKGVLRNRSDADEKLLESYRMLPDQISQSSRQKSQKRTSVQNQFTMTNPQHQHHTENIENPRTKYNKSSRSKNTFVHKIARVTKRRSSTRVAFSSEQQQNIVNVPKMFSFRGNNKGMNAHQHRRICVFDCRGRPAVAGNTLQGKGAEHAEHYTNMSVHFLDIGNIHTMRNSIQKVSDLCAHGGIADDDSHWLTKLEATGWLAHVRGMLAGAVRVAHTVDRLGCSVLLHCSDGWDRTAQVGAIAQIILDPYFRTLGGLAVLIDKEFVGFGHKFADRLSGANEERSPIFVQWLDAVHQVVRQMPSRFEFTEKLLVEMVGWAYSGRFGNFLWNTEQQREAAGAKFNTLSVWDFMLDPNIRESYTNPAFEPWLSTIWPSANPKRVVVWEAFFFGV